MEMSRFEDLTVELLLLRRNSSKIARCFVQRYHSITFSICKRQGVFENESISLYIELEVFVPSYKDSLDRMNPENGSKMDSKHPCWYRIIWVNGINWDSAVTRIFFFSLLVRERKIDKQSFVRFNELYPSVNYISLCI